MTISHLGGGEYIEPNVSTVEDNNGTHYNPIPMPITFTIDSGYDYFPHKIQKAYTWKELLDNVNLISFEYDKEAYGTLFYDIEDGGNRCGYFYLRQEYTLTDNYEEILGEKVVYLNCSRWTHLTECGCMDDTDNFLYLYDDKGKEVKVTDTVKPITYTLK